MKINIIGPYPPPYGGISVHIKRISKYLQNHDVEAIVYNEAKDVNKSEQVIPIKTYKKFLFKIPFLKGQIVHFHTTNIYVRAILFLYKLFNKKIILTIHGQSLHDQLAYSNIFIRNLLIFSLKKIDMTICVNPQTVDELIKLGVDKKRVIYIPSYLNPAEDEYDFKNIPETVWKFIDNSRFLISANGCIEFYNGEDLYGIDILIELINKLKINGYEVSLIIALLGCKSQNQEEKKYFQEIKSRIISYGLSKYIFVFEVIDTEFYPILEKSNLFLRTTNTDGYGVSIAEALHYKVPSAASDVCDRPNGTIIFRNRDIEDLYKKTTDIIKNYESYKNKLRNIEQQDNAGKILNIYRKVI